jgi:hypothetical protein
MKNFEFEKINTNRSLGKVEKFVYDEFERFIEKVKNNEVEDSGYWKGWDFTYFIDKKYNKVGVFFCPNKSKKGHKNIEFSVDFTGLDDRYCWLIREWCGLGNGSYCVFDRKTKRVIYREDD